MFVLVFLMKMWMHRIRTRSPYFGVFCPPLNEMLFITRPQRIATLCVAVLANFAVSATFLFATPASFYQTAITAVLSAGAMIPFQQTFPALFRAVNTFRSHTLRTREQQTGVRARLAKAYAARSSGRGSPGKLPSPSPPRSVKSPRQVVPMDLSLMQVEDDVDAVPAPAVAKPSPSSRKPNSSLPHAASTAPKPSPTALNPSQKPSPKPSPEHSLPAAPAPAAISAPAPPALSAAAPDVPVPSLDPSTLPSDPKSSPSGLVFSPSGPTPRASPPGFRLVASTSLGTCI